MGTVKEKDQRVRAPRWARLCAIFGAVLMVFSGGVLVTSEALMARYAGSVKTQALFAPEAAEATTKKEPVSEIKGPLNILLVGVDPRDNTTAPLSDSIIVVHVTASLRDAYLFSIPRDLIVDIPAYSANGFRGQRGKINSAMAFGSAKGNGKYDVGQGFGLLAQTVSQLTGIKRFNAGAILNFTGFARIVAAMGGVDMYVDERTKSEHRQPNGLARPRELYPRNPEHPYTGPQMIYEVGQQHLNGWQALDFVRQRYGLKGTDYARQRHQQQFLKAMAAKALSKNVVTNPVVLDRVLRAAGGALIFDGKGHDNIIEWGVALKGIRSESITMIKLPGGGVGVGSAYRGEALDPSARDFFAAVSADTVADFMIKHPEYVNRVQ